MKDQRAEALARVLVQYSTGVKRGDTCVIVGGTPAEPLRECVSAGTPVLATCAGLILLDREHLGVLDLTARRNAFGRQVASFETELDLNGLPGGPLRAVFIRAPWVEEAGDGVDVLGRVVGGAADGRIVAVRQGNLVATSFHPELTGDRRVHALFVDIVRRHLAERAGAYAGDERGDAP